MNLEVLKDRIYPWVKVLYDPDAVVPESTIAIEVKDEENPVYMPWLGNLAIFYVVDEGDNFSFILKRDLPSDISMEQLHQIAITNLEEDIEFRFQETNFGGYGLIAGGDHEAGAICLGGVWEWCSDQLNDDLIVAVPAKDMIMMVPASDSFKISKLNEFVVQLFEEGERLLTKQLFHYNRSTGVWKLWETAE